MGESLQVGWCNQVIYTTRAARTDMTHIDNTKWFVPGNTVKMALLRANGSILLNAHLSVQSPFATRSEIQRDILRPPKRVPANLQHQPIATSQG